jgi:two-component system sensor kinase FixL
VAHTRLNALLDAAADAMVLIDGRGRITRFNAAAQRIFGYSEPEVLGHNVSMLMPQPYRGEHDAYLDRYLSTSEPRIIGIGREVAALRKDGSTFPIDLSVGEFDSEGEHGFVGILRDISVRKAQEEKIRSSEEHLRLIFENAPTAIAITEPRGHITAANPAARRLLGHSEAELRKLRLSDLILPDDRAPAAAQMQATFQQGGQCEFEVRYSRKDGSVCHALTHASVAHDARGAPLMMICELVDRSELFEATHEADELRSRLTHVSRIGTLGEMVSGIAHEVNQPLTAIANYASACRRMLASGQATPEELAGTLEKIAVQSERAGDVIRGLRNLLRKRDQVRQPLDCNQLVREVVRITDFELRQNGFRLVQALAPMLPPVTGDGVQIQQIVLNLIRNALDAMALQASGDVVEISTASDGSWVDIFVADCGPGIPPAVAERLFEPFFTTKAEGIGLGLSICKSILTAHKGALQISTNAWGGTTFQVRLPAAAQEAGA